MQKNYSRMKQVTGNQNSIRIITSFYIWVYGIRRLLWLFLSIPSCETWRIFHWLLGETCQDILCDGKNPLQDFSGQHDDMKHIFLKVAGLRDEILHLPQLHPGGVGASHTYKYLEPKWVISFLRIFPSPKKRDQELSIRKKGGIQGRHQRKNIILWLCFEEKVGLFFKDQLLIFSGLIYSYFRVCTCFFFNC